MAGRIDVKDFRGAPEPSAAELSAAEASARADAAARAAALGYKPAVAEPAATLNTGAKMPLVGLGTWKSQRGAVKAAVLAAVRAGYRHIDCAAIYANEHEVGEAFEELFAEGVVARSDLFVTSKLWNAEHGSERARAACLKTLQDLRLDYLDLYLIHWPHSGKPGPAVDPPLSETWAALEALHREGRCRAIGVSNFSAAKIQALLDGGAAVTPAVLQIEAHPYWPNQELIDWATAKGIHVTAYSPLGSPDSAAIMQRAADAPRLLDDAEVARVAAALGRTPAQVLVRWAVQRGTSVLPKSTHAERIAQNLDVASWELPKGDFGALSRLPVRMRMVPGHFMVHAEGPYKTLEDLWDK